MGCGQLLARAFLPQQTRMHTMEIVTYNDGNAQLVGMSCDRCHHAVFDQNLEHEHAMDHFHRVNTDGSGGPLLEYYNNGNQACDLCRPCFQSLIGPYLKPIDATAPGFAYHLLAGPRMLLDAYRVWRKSIRLTVNE